MAYVAEPPQHPATTYYAPAYPAERPKELTTFGVLAFSSAALVTLFTVVTASVSGPAIRNLGAVESDFDWRVAAYAAGVFLDMFALAAGFVTGSLWLYRARKNAELLEPNSWYTRSAGWAWGGWVCPVVNFWFPFQVVRDTYRALSPYRTSSLVGWWWAFFLVESISLRIARTVESNATAADASTVQGWEYFASGTMVVALALWGLVLLRVSKEQHARMYAAAPGH